MYDVAIVGARCAGAPTAMLLARKGYRVLLVDRDTFPSDVISTHFIWPGGVGVLNRWGLTDRVLATNCPAVPRSRTYRQGREVLEEFANRSEGAGFGLCPRRILLDKLLIDAAVEAGVEFREGFTVSDVVRDDDRVSGVVGRHSGVEVVEQARLVIGADGLHSRIATRAGAETTESIETLVCVYYAYWSGIPMDAVELYAPVAGAGGLIAMPTNDGQVCVAVGLPIQRLSEVRVDIEKHYMETTERVAPSMFERMTHGRRESPFRGMADLPYYARKPYGPGWLLVGDAAYHVDPTLGYGISNAFRQIDLLVPALDDVLTDRRQFDQAMEEFTQLRNKVLQPYWDINLGVAREMWPASEPATTTSDGS